MNKYEQAICLDLKANVAAGALWLFGYCSLALESTRYILTIPSYLDPQVGGRRSVQRQLAYSAQGASKWRGPPEQAAHVQGEAVHFGLRDKLTGKFYFYDPDSQDPGVQAANEAFLNYVVKPLRKLGFVWGGDWRSFKDWQHFEKREDR